ncbi:MAG TPA: hypothetical protein VN924_29950 [Bryobacteraceae bacterium]|nr:hypothetical protein [Bryobacteraceae bacterium]
MKSASPSNGAKLGFSRRILWSVLICFWIDTSQLRPRKFGWKSHVSLVKEQLAERTLEGTTF